MPSLATIIFQSTPPARGATDNQIRRLHKQKHFNPRPREGGDIVDKLLSDMRKIISIHAPREGGDDHRGKDLPCRSPISIHAPREGGDAAGRSYIPHQAISIHAPREGGDPKAGTHGNTFNISIHAPREGGDCLTQRPAGGKRISIHAPREGGDHAGVLLISFAVNFNPRPPRGGRPSRRG